MEQFRMKEGSFKAVRRNWIFVRYPIGLAACAVLALRFSRRLGTRFSDWDINWTFFAVAMVVLAVGLAWITYQALIRERVVCDDYLLTIDRDTIKREQFGSDTITFGKNEITKISKEKGGTLIITRNSRADAIVVPPQIENSGKLELLLSGILPFS